MSRQRSPRLARTRRVTGWLPDPLVRLAKAARRTGWAVSGRLPGRGVAGPTRPMPAETPVRLLVGPANFAGQATEWARAADRFLPGVSALSMAVDRGGLAFPADYAVPLRAYRSHAWEVEQRRWLRDAFTHVLIDAMRPVTGALHGEDCSRELAWLLEAGLRVGLVAHGSDVRLPSRHRALYPRSPFDPTHTATRQLERQAGRLGRIINGYEGPTFVSTPDLLDFVPAATWLPTVVHVETWQSPARPALERSRPVIVHIPTSAWLKGSDLADPVLNRLHDAGVVEYRRLERLSPEEVRREVLDADVVLDQLLLGAYGVVAVQAMSSGRLVLGHVPPRVRDRIGRDLPVLEVTPDSLGEAVEAVAADPERFARRAATGPEYAREVHDGRRSAQALAEFLGSGPG